MEINYPQLSVPEATALQKKMRESVRIEPFDREIKFIAGADLSFNRFSPVMYGGIVVFSWPELEPVQVSLVKTESHFPYVSGYLAFREVPAIQLAWDQLEVKPDILILDGQGITHPRMTGVATHFGVMNDWPTIGCAKKSLFGSFLTPDIPKFSKSEITGKEGELLGYALRTKNAVKPIFVSPGHRMDPDSALRIIMHCVRGYRIPEPTRLAHEMVNKLRIGELEAGVHPCYEAAM